ncbi:smalltalk protein [Bacteroides ihuae]|nr:smalltalk protein [Bacteroides ihuae]
MKKLNWNVILKVVIAVGSAVLGALGANAMA